MFALQGPSEAMGLKVDSGYRGPSGSRGPTGKRCAEGPEGPPGKIGKMGHIGARGGIGAHGVCQQGPVRLQEVVKEPLVKLDTKEIGCSSSRNCYCD